MRSLNDLTQKQLRDLIIDFTKYKQLNGWGNKSLDVYYYYKKVWSK